MKCGGWIDMWGRGWIDMWGGGGYKYGPDGKMGEEKIYECTELRKKDKK